MLFCTHCHKTFDLQKEFEKCPECKRGFLVSKSFTNTIAKLKQENKLHLHLMNGEKCSPSLPDSDYSNEFDAHNKLKHFDDFNNSLSSEDVSEQEFMLATLTNDDETPETRIQDSLDIFIETFRDRDEEGNITDETQEFIG